MMHPRCAGAGRVLVVDDDPVVLRSLGRQLLCSGYTVETAADGQEAVARVKRLNYDAVLSDIAMPELDGIQLLREIRAHDLHVPVVLITGAPTVDTAVQALEHGAFHYLTKPISSGELKRVLDKAVRTCRMLRAKPGAAEQLGDRAGRIADRADLEACFASVMQTLWVAYHPIVCAQSHTAVGYEALLRSHETALPTASIILHAADQLGLGGELGRAVRDRAAADLAGLDHRRLLFVNVRPSDLLDHRLTSADAPLSKLANQVVLEVTERMSLEGIRDMRKTVARLREIGFRLAIDDLGAGYAGLTSFAQLEPEFVKLDLTLVRDVHVTPVKQKVIRTMASLAKDMGMRVVAEGIETWQERDAVVELGCDLLQGFHFARPGKPFPSIQW